MQIVSGLSKIICFNAWARSWST